MDINKKEVEGRGAAAGPSNSSNEDNTSKNKLRNRGRKRKRRSSSSEDGLDLPDNTLETERNLQASAAKNNLDENSVRKILKKVVTNDHVLALVKLQEEEEGDSGSEDKGVQPKLTRAKAKELKKVSPRSAPWNLENLELTPINHIPVKTRPEVHALISHELPEDEDDEEYEPNHDDVPSDDDHDHSCSDLDSQPRTPATPASQCTPSPKVLRDGPFKVPQEVSSARRKLNVDEEATIALRTRSKLSLSTTTIEHIESSFVPPDDVQPPVDNLWSEFLTGCLDPAATHEEDDEADPEYNAAADADTFDEEEDFLGSSLIKISKKELNDLVTELFNVMPATDEDLTLENLANSVLTDTNQTEVPRWEGKTEPLSDEESNVRPSKRLTFEKGNTVTLSPGKSESDDIPRPTNHVPCERVEPISTRSRRTKENSGKEISKAKTRRPKRRPSNGVHICIEERSSSPSLDVSAAPPALREQLQPDAETVHIQLNSEVLFTPEQLLILQQQLRMHIQLAASNFLQLFLHPIHWKLGPTYRGYLETLEKLGDSYENSVVKVCNLEPALELVRNWEENVSQDTKENREMVEFINDQTEKSRRRYAQNCIYLGDFPEPMKELVVNSPVFLYPCLLPAMPYKADIPKRVVYLHSENELIVLGLDQFWRYMEANPTIFRKPKVINSRHRWGLATALQLVTKHMLPWMTPKQLACHVTALRTQVDRDNPIYNYFNNNELPKVNHTILRFNPNITLYEQPQHEIPRLWVRYLAKFSMRFKNFLSSSTLRQVAMPIGVPVKSVTSESTFKVPLPHDFTKVIKCTRNPEDPMTKQNGDKNNITNSNNEAKNTKTSLDDVPLNMYKLVSTSKGSFLVPLEIITVGSNNTGTVTPSNREVLEVKNKLTVSTGTVTTPAEVTSKVQTVPNTTLPAPKPIRINEDHCPCCILLRKITKRQTVITEYFSKDKSKKKCYCSEIEYPNVTNKLRLLSNNFKNNTGLVYKELERLLNDIESGKVSSEDDRLGRCTMDELVSVTTFQLKILSRSLMSRFSYIKVRCKNLLTQFNPQTGDPILLSNALFKTCQKEMVDLYLDFLEFMTPEQADKLGKFKDYFIRNCARDLMNRVEEQVKDPVARARILSQLRHVFTDSTSTACQICSYLLESMAGYDALAKHTFSLFPHRKETRVPFILKTSVSAPVAHLTINQSEAEPRVTIVQSEKQTNDTEMEDKDGTMDCENDSSSGSEEVDNETVTASLPADQKDLPESTETTCTEIKIEPDLTMDIEENQITHNTITTPSSESVIVTLTEVIKEEPTEWKREDDKLILEVLKQQLTPEERKDNIPEMLEEKNVFGLLAETITNKSKEEVKERVLYILSLLVLSEKLSH